jgi:hypothetical protein
VEFVQGVGQGTGRAFVTAQHNDCIHVRYGKSYPEAQEGHLRVLYEKKYATHMVTLVKKVHFAPGTKTGSTPYTGLLTLPQQMKMAREHTLAGHYSTALVFFEDIVSQLKIKKRKRICSPKKKKRPRLKTFVSTL